MTALNWLLEEDKCVIAADTLAFTQANQPKHFVSKILPLPHLNMVLCGTGNAELIMRYYMVIQTIVIAKDLYSLNSTAQSILTQLNNGYPQKMTSKIFHFGYNSLYKCFEGFMFQSVTNFQCEKITYGFGVHPLLPIEVVYNLWDCKDDDDDYFTLLIKEQRKEENVGIGGEIQRVILNNKSYEQSTIYRFDDYDANYELMLKALNAQSN